MSLARAADAAHGPAWAAAVADRLEALGVRALLPGEPDYPEGLRDLDPPPRVAFVRGVVPPLARAVAIVGSRAASPYGRAVAGALAADLARLGYAVVSGLARGIDAAAHAGALEACGRGVAVLPGGLDAVTPPEHAALADALAARGALVSEWASGAPARPGLFVRRNRLIAALAAATVVVEAAERSGALSTAAAARRLGRPVLAVPGDVDRPTSRGTHALIRAGARLCEGAADVVRALADAGVGAGADAADPADRLRAALEPTPQPLDRLARRAALDVAEALPALLALEWAGLARALPGQRWARAEPERR